MKSYLDMFCRSAISASHPSRGAWIEMYSTMTSVVAKMVAPLTGCVD